MRKILHVGIMVLAFIFLLTACSKANKVAAGIYRADGDMAVIIVQDDNTMIITGPIEVSVAFTGRYVIEGNELILTIPEQENYTFLIQDGELVLESGEWLESWVEQGTTFYLSEE